MKSQKSVYMRGDRWEETAEQSVTNGTTRERERQRKRETEKREEKDKATRERTLFFVGPFS